jgi:hypothetical protein
VWYLLQGLIIFAVVGSNIHWQWADNTYAVSFLGVVAAYVATALLNNLLEALRSRKRPGRCRITPATEK